MAKQEIDNGVVMNALNGRGNYCQDARNLSTSSATLSLPILSANYETNESLQNCFHRNPNGFFLVKITGNYWPECDWHAASAEERAFKVYYLLTRVSLGVLFLTYVITLVTATNASVFTVLAVVTVCVDTIAVIPAQMVNQKRMLQPARVQDASVIDESAKIAAYHGIVFVVATVTFVLVFVLLNLRNGFSVPILFILLWGELSISAYLVYNLLILILDLKVSSLLLDQLFLLADSKTLTLDNFYLARNEIHRRVAVSKWASDFILVPCICSTIVLVVICTSTDIRAFNLALLLIKEIQFVGVAFWYVAKVNEKADLLTRKLCATMWNKNSADCECADKTVTDTERLSICSTALAEPISFTLLFKRLNLQNVALSFVGFAASVLGGLIKQAVLRN